MKHVLLLNSDWTPLNFIADRHAVLLQLRGCVETVIDENSRQICWQHELQTVNAKYTVPAVLRLKRFVNKNWGPPRFRKKVLFNRDEWKCRYCGTDLNWQTITIDHLLPLSRGGKTTWQNCVSACRHYNRKKADKTPVEAQMNLRQHRVVPSIADFWVTCKPPEWHESWNDFVKC